MRLGDETGVQDLLWSGTKILNSCDQKLRDKIIEATTNYFFKSKTGPVYFKITMNYILSSSPVSMRFICRKLETVTLKEFKGENVHKAISIIRGAVSLLGNNHSLPLDLMQIIFNFLKTSSTDLFSQYFTTIETNYDTGVKIMILNAFAIQAQKSIHNWSMQINGW